jgi:hypothetical protein
MPGWFTASTREAGAAVEGVNPFTTGCSGASRERSELGMAMGAGSVTSL